MGKNVDPCSNFYEYACGGFGQNPGQTVSVIHSATESLQASLKFLLEETPAASDETLNAAKSLYRNCIAFEGLKKEGTKPGEVLNQIMTSVGTWPVVDTYFDYSNLLLDHRLAALTIFGIPVAFKVEVVSDSKTPGSFLMKLTPGGPRETGRTAMEIRSDSKLKTSLTSAFVLLGSTYTRSVSDADDILSVESQYASIEQDIERCNSTDHISSQEIIGELNRLMPEMNWTILIATIQQVSGFHKPFPVELHCKEKIRDYLVYLKDLTSRSAYNYLGWRFFSTFQDHILPDLRDAERSKHCLPLLEMYFTSLLPKALRLSRETLEKVRKIAKDVQSGLQQSLSKAKWLKEEERSKLLKQVAGLHLLLSDYQKQSKTSQHMPQINLENYTDVIIEFRRQSVVQDLKKLNPDEAYEEIMKYRRMPLPNETLPFSADSLTIDLASPVILEKIREPFFQDQGPEWLNYGSLGSHIAREISKILFEEKIPASTSQCFLRALKESYDMYNNQIEQFGDELFLDAISIEAAYESIKDKKSSEKKYLPGLDKSKQQMFFVSYAQSFCEAKNKKESPQHIPIKERINTLVANTAYFEEAFQCNFPKKESEKCLR